MTTEHKQETLNEQYDKVKTINRERRRNFIKQMRVEKQDKRPTSTKRECHAKLLAINQYGKLIFQSNHDDTIDHLMEISEEYKSIPMKKMPFWSSDKDDGLIIKLSVPKFLSGQLFQWQKMIGKMLAFQIEAHDYQSDKFGTGWYLKLASELTPLQ